MKDALIVKPGEVVRGSLETNVPAAPPKPNRYGRPGVKTDTKLKQSLRGKFKKD